MNKTWLSAFFLIGFLLTFFYVWPGFMRYQYITETYSYQDTVPVRNSLGMSDPFTTREVTKIRSQLVRIDRLTGQRQVQDGDTGRWENPQTTNRTVSRKPNPDERLAALKKLAKP